MTAQPPQSIPTEAYATFVGIIDQVSASRLTHWLDVASQGIPVPKVHLLFQSLGGVVGDGVYLYNFFRTLPLDLTIYNAGAVESAAVIAFLGARYRKAAKTAVFMLHETKFSGQPANATQLKTRSQTLAIDDQRTIAILKKHLTLDQPRWDDLHRNEIWFTADEAMAMKMVDGITDFAPPAGTKLWDFNAPWS